MSLVHLTNMRNKSLWVVSDEINSHIDLLLKVVLVVAGPRLGKVGLVVLLKESALSWLFVAATHV